jgi:hypothetical protein
LYYLFSVFDFLLLGKKSKKFFETKQKQRPLSQFLKTTVSGSNVFDKNQNGSK